MRRTALALMAHPDDAEILCGGVLCLLADRGWSVHVATATPGDCGTATLAPEEIAAVRRREAADAAARLGGTYRCLENRDLRVVYGEELLARACRVLREVRPRLVITHSPSDYMIDHEETSRIARASCFNAPIPNAPVAGPEGAPPPLESIPALYYADPIEGRDALGDRVLPRRIIDISSTVERKAELLACHVSQREWLKAHHGIDEYLEGMRRWGRERGRLAHVAYGEGYRQHLGHAYPAEDILASELRPFVHCPGG